MADFAQRPFGHPFTSDQVIEETLVTFTEGTNPSLQELTTTLGGPIPTTLDLFRRHPAGLLTLVTGSRAINHPGKRPA